MRGAVDLCRFHQVVRKADIELAEHEDGRRIEPVRQDDRPQVIVQADCIEQREARQDRHFHRHHHRGQEKEENEVLAAEMDLGKGVCGQGREKQLDDRTDDGNENGIAVGLEHVDLAFLPDVPVIIPLRLLRQEMEIGGINAAIEAQKAKKELQNQKFDNFEYSKIDNTLLNELNISFDKINDYKTEFIEVNVKATVKKDKYKFPKTNEAAKIDGSFKVNLYNRNKTVLLASGYYVATGRRGNDKSLTGYNFVSKEKTILLKKQPNVKINLSDGYQIEFTDPKLWFLKI